MALTPINRPDRIAPILVRTMRLSGRVTRLIAKLMIFAWLFGVALSVANACVMQAGRAGQPTAHPPGLADVHVAGPASVDDEHRAQASKQACKSFCDAAQSTVAKTASATVDLAQAPPPSALTAAWPKQAALLDADAAWRGAGPAPPPRLAPAILFLRLTL